MIPRCISSSVTVKINPKTEKTLLQYKIDEKVTNIEADKELEQKLGPTNNLD